VDVQSAATLDHPLHGVTSTAMCAGARRSILLTTLLGVLDGNNAGSRKLPRQFWLGLEVPHTIDVSGRRRGGDDSPNFMVQGGPQAHHHFGEGHRAKRRGRVWLGLARSPVTAGSMTHRALAPGSPSFGAHPERFLSGLPKALAPLLEV
jgi:hypothetical protein